jgi:hypothetical protein
VSSSRRTCVKQPRKMNLTKAGTNMKGAMTAAVAPLHSVQLHFPRSADVAQVGQHCRRVSAVTCCQQYLTVGLLAGPGSGAQC